MFRIISNYKPSINGIVSVVTGFLIGQFYEWFGKERSKACTKIIAEIRNTED